MTATPDERALVEKFFGQYVNQFMKSDLENAINGGANLLAALGLVTYSEVLGALKLGTISKDEGNRRKFDAFLPSLGTSYHTADGELKSLGYKNGLYQVVRCGLVHQYFPKESSLVARSGPGLPGVSWETTESRLVIVLRTFLDDFLRAADEVKVQIIAAPPTETLNFMSRYMETSGTAAHPGTPGGPPPPGFTSGAVTTGTYWKP